jgi:hypothetical protein
MAAKDGVARNLFGSSTSEMDIGRFYQGGHPHLKHPVSPP